MDIELLIPVPVHHRSHSLSPGGLRGTVRELVPPGCRPMTHAPGRVCAHPGCDTVLSVYNPGRYCAAHPQSPPEWATGTCSECGALITRKSKSGLCRRCVKRSKPRTPFTSLRRGGRPDAIQRAQRAVRAAS